MEKTQITIEANEQILKNLSDAKAIVNKQTHIFASLLINKLTENFKVLNKERVTAIFERTFYTQVNEDLATLFDYYQKNECEFYGKNLNTADLVFNTLSDKRTQRIYLQNILKKVSQNNQDIKKIFTTPIKDIVNGVETQNSNVNISKNTDTINSRFSHFVQVIINNPELSVYDVDDIRNCCTHYFNQYRNDVTLVLNKLFDSNKSLTANMIEEEMDNKQLLNGKSSAMVKMERNITNNSLKVIEELLNNSISKHKEIAKNSLSECSSSVVDFIFKLLPAEYQDQKPLIEVIIDTNINEKLGKLLEEEVNKIYDNLLAKDRDIIENELYEEKRYKEIEDYKCDFQMVEKVYQSVLNEVKLAYDIDVKRLDLLILGESNSTKNVFVTLFNSIKNENKRNLDAVILEMERLSSELYNENTINTKVANPGPRR